MDRSSVTRHAATDAVSALLVMPRLVIEVTPAVRYTVRAPCLLRQLAHCVVGGMERGGRGVPGSRAPAAIEALDLWHEVAHDTHAWAAELKVVRRDPGDDHPIPWVGRLLRTVAATAISRGEEDMATTIARVATRWAGQITAMVTGTPEQRGVRGAACPDCEATSIIEAQEGGEHMRRPAIVLVTREVDGHPLRWLACQACGWTRTLGADLELTV
jgi:hypothetical protein